MITSETNDAPSNFHFDVAVVAVGYERRCRWVAENFSIDGHQKVGLEFGFLREGSYAANKLFFEASGWKVSSAQESNTFQELSAKIASIGENGCIARVFVDISSMSREMMANVALAIERARSAREIHLVISYAPSEFGGAYHPAPIRLAEPMMPELAGWSSRPDKPLGAIVGLGCEPDMALGALQVIEPNKAWLYTPRGIDERFDETLSNANQHVADIFDVTNFEYAITDPHMTRGKLEALLNSVDQSFRIVAIPFGPKIFAWLTLATVVFDHRRSVGVWAFSSKEEATVVDRPSSGAVVWYQSVLPVVN
jgi:hypothetical protein